MSFCKYQLVYCSEEEETNITFFDTLREYKSFEESYLKQSKDVLSWKLLETLSSGNIPREKKVIFSYEK